MNSAQTIQIINEKTKNILKNRLKRDELTKRLLELRLDLYRSNILIEAEYTKMADLKIRMYNRMIQVCESYKKNRRNNILIELEHRKMTEMKLNIVSQLLVHDNGNLTSNFDFKREIEIDRLTNSMNYDSPPMWDENRDKYLELKAEIETEIKFGEDAVSSFDTQGQIHVRNLNQMFDKKRKIENEIESLTEQILPLNDTIEEEPEHHPITLIKIADATTTADFEELAKDLD